MRTGFDGGRTMAARWTVALVCVLAAAGTSLAGAAPAGAAALGDYAYVVNATSNTVTEYAPGAFGNAAPIATITGANTGLNGPDAIAVDAVGDIYVANGASGSGSVVEFAPGANGDATPIATIAGASTTLVHPTGIALDSLGDLYVTDSSSGSVIEFAPGANGDATPSTTISGQDTMLHDPTGIALDTNRNIYVSNGAAADPSVSEFAAGASGDQTPSAQIAGSSTQLVDPVGLALDAAGHVWVVNRGGGTPAVDEYPLPSSTGSSVAPIGSITGTSTQLGQPSDVAIDSAGNLAVTNTSTNTVTEYATGTHGNAPPAAAITGLSAPTAVALVDAAGVSVSCAPASVVAGQSTTCTATAAGSSAAPTGTVHFANYGAGAFSAGACALAGPSATSSSCSVTFTPSATTGTDEIAATYHGQESGDPARGEGHGTLAVPTRATATSLSCTPARVPAGQQTACVAQVSDASGASPFTAPTGTVEFLDGATTISACHAQALSAPGTATCSLTFFATHAHAITAIYRGDVNYASSTSAAQTVTVVAALVAPGGTAVAAACYPKVGRARVRGRSARVAVTPGPKGASCRITVRLQVTERVRGSKVLSIAAARRKVRTKILTLGTATVTIAPGQTRTVSVALNRTGRRLLAHARLHRLEVELAVTRRLNSRTNTVSHTVLTFKAPRRRR